MLLGVVLMATFIPSESFFLVATWNLMYELILGSVSCSAVVINGVMLSA